MLSIRAGDDDRLEVGMVQVQLLVAVIAGDAVKCADIDLVAVAGLDRASSTPITTRKS